MSLGSETNSSQALLRSALGLLTFVCAVAQADSNLPDLADVVNPERAKINYMLNCQGCHGQQGSASPDGAVPAMQGELGKFLQVPGGRAFLVQVPGSANAAMSDADLAEVLNWILLTQSRAELPSHFQPFSTEEVHKLRQHPETDVVGTRAVLVQAIKQMP